MSESIEVPETGANAPEVMTKRQFANLLGRDPAFVSRALATGKIQGAALVGTGRHARIVVPVALAQLGRSLDFSQQLAQKQPILPSQDISRPADQADTAPGAAGDCEPGLLPLGPPADAQVAGPGGPADFGYQRQRHLELRNRKIALEVERAEIERARLAGQLVPADDVAAALRRQVAPMMSIFEEVPAVVAKALAERHGLDYSTIVAEVRAALRRQRAAWAEQARALLRGAEVTEAAAAPPPSRTN